MDQKYLTHDNEVFETMMKNLDLMMERTIGSMIMRDADESTITLKIGISLDRKNVPADGGGFRQLLQPSFKHDLSSVMQVKDKMSGTFKGNVEIIFDENGKPIVRDIDDGQTSIFDDEGNVSVEPENDKDSEMKALNPGKFGIPEKTIIEGEYKGADEIDVSQAPFKPEGDSEQSPYEYLLQYRDQALRCQNNNGVYVVRSNKDGKVLLSTGYVNASPFHVKSETLKPHVGHNLICVANPEKSDDPDEIEIWCDDCGVYLFGILNPEHQGKETASDEDSGTLYEYESPDKE